MKVSDRRANDGPTHPTFVRYHECQTLPPAYHANLPWCRTSAPPTRGGALSIPLFGKRGWSLRSGFVDTQPSTFLEGGGRRCRGKLRIRRKFVTR